MRKEYFLKLVESDCNGVLDLTKLNTILPLELSEKIILIHDENYQDSNEYWVSNDKGMNAANIEDIICMVEWSQSGTSNYYIKKDFPHFNSVTKINDYIFRVYLQECIYTLNIKPY